jgi:hypothetical protein
VAYVISDLSAQDAPLPSGVVKSLAVTKVKVQDQTPTMQPTTVPTPAPTFPITSIIAISFGSFGFVLCLLLAVAVYYRHAIYDALHAKQMAKKKDEVNKMWGNFGPKHFSFDDLDDLMTATKSPTRTGSLATRASTNAGPAVTLADIYGGGDDKDWGEAKDNEYFRGFNPQANRALGSGNFALSSVSNNARGFNPQANPSSLGNPRITNIQTTRPGSSPSSALPSKLLARQTAGQLAGAQRTNTNTLTSSALTSPLSTFEKAEARKNGLFTSVERQAALFRSESSTNASMPRIPSPTNATGRPRATSPDRAPDMGSRAVIRARAVQSQETINFMSPQIQNARLSPRALSAGLATGGRGFRRKGRNPSGM